MSTHLPIRALRPLQRQCLYQRSTAVGINAARPFSTTSVRPSKHRFKGIKGGRFQAEAAIESNKSRAPATLQKEGLLEGSSLPEDLGIIPGTIVRGAPFSGELPSLFSYDRLRFEYKYLLSLFSGYFSLWKYRTTRRAKPYPTVDFVSTSQVKKVAKQKYQEMYEAFAARELEKIEKICSESLVEQFKERLMRRAPEVKMHFQINKFISVRVISNRAVTLPLPGLPESASRQVVVRIKSEQAKEIKWDSIPGMKKATRRQGRLAWTPTGSQPEKQEPEHEHEDGEAAHRMPIKRIEKFTEYIILQKRMLRGQEGEWKILSFAEPHTLESIAKDEEYQNQVAEYQASSA